MSAVIEAFNKINPWYWLRKLSDDSIGIFPIVGTPTDGTSGTGVNVLGIGAMVVDVSTGLYYVNTGTKASPVWTGLGGAVGTTLADGKILAGNAGNVATAVTPSGDVTMTNAGVFTVSQPATAGVKVSGQITAANIIGTSAGQFGHAQGVVLQAAPSAGVALQPIALGLYYDFATAAYTAGGNITLNYGSGGAALTGLVSAANSVGAAVDKAVMFFPLAAAGNPVVST